jgi:hypothetical protein
MPCSPLTGNTQTARKTNVQQPLNQQQRQPHYQQYPHNTQHQPPNSSSRVVAPTQQPSPVNVNSQPAVWNTPRMLKPNFPSGVSQIVLGLFGIPFFSVMTASGFSVVLGYSSLPQIVAGLGLTAACLAGAIGSAVLLANGIGKHNLSSRATRLIGLFQNKLVYTVSELAVATGRKPKQLKRDLKKIQKKGYLPEIRLDPNENFVIWGREAYDHYLMSEHTRQQKLLEEEERKKRLLNPATADIERFRSEGELIVQKIRAANDAIPGEEISAKLDTLEETTILIFKYVERFPEKLPDTRKFMSHYLPMTLKLVDKYHQYDKMDYKPENVRKTKVEIERSLDTINLAFSNLFESLFTHDTLDVATDIEVLEKMLEQEGLTGSRFKIDSPEITKRDPFVIDSTEASDAAGST